MFFFIENLTGLEIIINFRKDNPNKFYIIIIDNRLSCFLPSNIDNIGFLIRINQPYFKFFKVMLGLLQFPVVLQDPTSLIHRFNFWKRIISDGLLTEYLYTSLNVPIKVFYSIELIKIEAPIIDLHAIIGTNWFEFGSMTESSYIYHLHFLKSNFPDAVYFPHPKEVNPHPFKIFGPNNCLRPNEPLETWFRNSGIPSKVTSVCSTSLVMLGMNNIGALSVNLISINNRHFDGFKRNILESFNKPIKEVSCLTVTDVQEFIISILKFCKVKYNIIYQH